MRTLFIGLLAALFATSVLACPPTRSATAKRHFRAMTVCPSTALKSKTCPGYVIDHIVPLCAKGKDTPANMQFQSIADAKRKDKLEKAQCAAIRKK